MAINLYPPFIQSRAELELVNQGKVRDIYRFNENKLLIIASDRISAFDQVLETSIEGKGIILTKLAYFWLNQMGSIIPTHLKGNPKSNKELTDALKHLNLPKEVIDRAMLVNEIKPLPIEAVVRGYLIGSGYKEYQETSKVCGISLDKGLKEFSKLSEPIFTPATKAKIGSHDINISIEEVNHLIGTQLASQVRDISLAIYQKAYQFALKKGIIIADTKFEFGLDNNQNLTLIDEALTPDSSRFYALDDFQVGGKNKDYSKQIIRDYLLEAKEKFGNMPMTLPKEIVQKSQKRYQDILTILTS